MWKHVAVCTDETVLLAVGTNETVSAYIIASHTTSCSVQVCGCVSAVLLLWERLCVCVRVRVWLTSALGGLHPEWVRLYLSVCSVSNIHCLLGIA